MKYAVIRNGGKQYRVKEGDELDVEKIPIEEGKSITLNEVLLFVEGENIILGQPVIDGLKVKANVLKEFKGEKIRVGRFRPKSRYAKIKGHRQHLTKIKITEIVYGKNKTRKDN